MVARELSWSLYDELDMSIKEEVQSQTAVTLFAV